MKIIKALFVLCCLWQTSTGQSQWDIQLSLGSVDCPNEQVCYQVGLQNTSGSDWALGDQNYRFFFDGDNMTVVSVSSLLPPAFYGSANIDQNIKISGQGQQAASPLDDIDDNLGFLDFSIVQVNKSNPPGATQIITNSYTPVAEICIDVINGAMYDTTGTKCLVMYHSRPSTAGAITNQYTTISENNLPNSTIATIGVNFDDLTPADGDSSCLGSICTPGSNSSEWDIQLALNSIDCDADQACYLLQVKNSAGSDWTLSDQNYRFFFDGDYMTVTSVSSLLPAPIYGNAVIDQNVKISGQGQEAASPLDDIDDNLGFLDFSIAQIDKSNPPGATQLTTTGYTSVAEICIDVINGAIDDLSGTKCLTMYHSRPSTAGTFTSQYTIISENNLPNSTIPTVGVLYDDLTPSDSDASCVGYECGCQAMGQILSN